MNDSEEIYEGAEALRYVNDVARKSRKKSEAAKQAHADVKDTSDWQAPEFAVPPIDPDDPLEGLTARCKANPSAVFDPLVIDDLVALYEDDRTEYQRILSDLKAADAPITRLDNAVRAEARKQAEARKGEESHRADQARRVQEENAQQAKAQQERERAQSVTEKPWRERHYGEVKLSSRLIIRMEPGRITAFRSDANGNTEVIVLANFSGFIRQEVLYYASPDAPPTRRFEVELLLEGEDEPRVEEIKAEEFTLMRWVEVFFGANACVAPHRGSREELRAGLQSFHRAERKVCHRYTGWATVDSGRVYLSAGACIGEHGAERHVSTKLDHALDKFAMPAPPEGDALRMDLLESLALFTIDPPEVIVPVLGFTWRQVLGPVRGSVNGSVLLLAPKGEGKTTLAMLGQQHYGVRFEVPPAEWGKNQSSTGSLTVLSTRVGDAVCVIDDLVLTGVSREDREQMMKVDAVLRSQFNGTTALRLTRDRELQETSASRCGVIATAENNPQGHSLRDRFLTLELARRSATNLDPFKEHGRSGTYARAVAGCIRWLAPQLETMRERAACWHAEAVGLFRAAYGDRVAMMLADLTVGVRLLGCFAVACGATTVDQARDLEQFAAQIFHRVGAAQQRHHDEEDPALRFGPLISQALRGGFAHVKLCKSNEAPPNPSLWGWMPNGQITEAIDNGKGEYTTLRVDAFRPSGTGIGYLDPKKEPTAVFLNAGLALTAVRAHAMRTGHPFPLTSEPELLRRLYDRGLLAATDREVEKRPLYTKRKRAGGKQDDFICLKSEALGIADIREDDTSDDTDEQPT